MHKLPTISILVVFFAGTVACRGPLPCDDCDADLPAEEEEGDPLPDLPCGGAEDNRFLRSMSQPACGQLGRFCTLMYLY